MDCLTNVVQGLLQQQRQLSDLYVEFEGPCQRSTFEMAKMTLHCAPLFAL